MQNASSRRPIKTSNEQVLKLKQEAIDELRKTPRTKVMYENGKWGPAILIEERDPADDD